MVLVGQSLQPANKTPHEHDHVSRAKHHINHKSRYRDGRSDLRYCRSHPQSADLKYENLLLWKANNRANRPEAVSTSQAHRGEPSEAQGIRRFVVTSKPLQGAQIITSFTSKSTYALTHWRG
ncbi:hypothetical protein CSPX01_12021 [Colletotrichum filicis]|nr:hypothetical protein CSPX01_12021 [Colletotrichum filicis]